MDDDVIEEDDDDGDSMEFFYNCNFRITIENVPDEMSALELLLKRLTNNASPLTLSNNMSAVVNKFSRVSDQSQDDDIAATQTHIMQC